MVETLGIVLAIIGLVFAFEAPRKWLIALFRKSIPVEHEFKVHTVFHAHNNGKELGPLGSNKTDKGYVLTWVVRNCSDHVIQFERGIVMQQRESDHPELTLTLPQFSEIPPMFPQHRHEVLSLQLTPGEVDHFRHWVKECNAFGLKDSSGMRHWIPDNQFQVFSSTLQKIAGEYGLAKEVPEGKRVLLKVTRTPNNSIQATPKSGAPDA